MFVSSKPLSVFCVTLQKLAQVRKRMAQVERKLTELGVDVNHRSIFLLLVWIWVPTVVYAFIFFLYDLIVYFQLSISFRLWFFEVMYSWSQNIGIIVLLDFMTYVRYVAHFQESIEEIIPRTNGNECSRLRSLGQLTMLRAFLHQLATEQLQTNERSAEEVDREEF